jgi:hypothetical protein
MKKTTIWGLAFLLSAGMAAFGQATLPAFYSGPWSTTNLPTGWTKVGLGGDYASNYDSVDGTAAKFDGSGDFISIFFNSAPATVSYFAQGNSLAGAYVYKVQESVNGTTWTDVVTYDSGNLLNNSSPLQYTNFLSSSSRYVKFLFVTKATGNVGLDGVRIAGPSVPSVGFNPSGSQSIPVSNTLTLAVAIAPPGSGMQSWSMVPAYVGPASLTNGSFSFTPAAGDNGKNLTLSVVATNSVGTSTGTASIAVTAYAPPVPVIAFSPAAPYSLMATYTQKLGIAVTPAGSGIQGWTLLPSNYAGSATLVGTNFTFTTAQADGPSNYVFSVVATNVFGSTTGTASIAVSTYVAPPVAGSYIASFEDGAKTGYASGDVTLSNKVWNLTGILIGTDADDKKLGSKSARLKYDPTDGEETMTVQSTVLSNGVGTVSLWYAPYGSHGEQAPTLAIEISESLVSGWVEVGSVAVGAVSNLTYYSADVFVSTPIYVRIRATSGTSGKSANFDNVTITPYSSPASSPYNAFLLQYNVTPGDPGTAAGDDLDGDGFSNTNEFTAGTNPYDEAIHP